MMSILLKQDVLTINLFADLKQGIDIIVCLQFMICFRSQFLLPFCIA